MLESIKNGYEYLKRTIVRGVVLAEDLAGLTGEQKKEWVVKFVDDSIKLPAFWDDVINVDGRIIGILIDRAVGVLNSIGAGPITSSLQTEAIASVLDVPHEALASAASRHSSVDERIESLFKQYGIGSAPSTVTSIVAPLSHPVVGSSDPNWAKSLDLILRAEGGYVDHPKDTGGPTNMGITHGTLALAMARGIVPKVDIKNLTKDQAATIYKNMYWLPAGCDKVAWPVCYMLYDTTVNGGLGMTSRVFQEALNATFNSGLDVDGKWGPKTRAEIMSRFGIDKSVLKDNTTKFGTAYLEARKAYYDRIIAKSPSQKVFQKGWYNRLRELAKQCDLVLPKSLEI